MDITDLDGCEFLIESLGEINLTDIQAHLETCRNCRDELTEAFTNYQATGSGYILEICNIEMAGGISSEMEFLKSWHFQSCSNEEKNESVLMSLQNKLKQKDVQYSLQKLRLRQTRIARLIYLKGSAVLVASFASSVVQALHGLYILLGPREFSLFMNDEYEERENTLLELTSFWENLGKEESFSESE